jgi:hypothetical protein
LITSLSFGSGVRQRDAMQASIAEVRLNIKEMAENGLFLSKFAVWDLFGQLSAG